MPASEALPTDFNRAFSTRRGNHPHGAAHALPGGCPALPRWPPAYGRYSDQVLNALSKFTVTLILSALIGARTAKRESRMSR